MKKISVTFLILALVLGALSGLASAEELTLEVADFEVEYLAAPAVAGLILEEWGIDNRFGQGKDGGNYIALVAHQMIGKAMFPAYDWYGRWDGETYIEKCDVDAHYQAVYNYLVKLGAPLPKSLTVELLEEIADGFIYQPFKTVSGGSPTVRVTDVHGNPVEGLGMRVSLPTIAEISGIVLTDSNGLAVFDSLIYGSGGAGTYRANFYIADSTVRAWAGYSRALSNWFDLYSMEGSWFMRADRVVVIASHTATGFSGTLQSETGTIFGNIAGTLDFNGDVSIAMNYDRVGYATDGYFGIFTGTMTDFNTATGIRVHGNNGVLRNGDGEPTAWSMTRQ